MTTITKNNLKATAIMAIITAVSIAILSVLNAILPKYKATLDEATIKLIKEICVADSYETYEYDGLDTFNSEFGTAKLKALAVYKAVGGINDGAFIIETTCGNSYGDFVILTAYDKNATAILGTRYKKGTQTAPGGPQAYDRAGFYEFFVGKFLDIKKGAGTISVSSGATYTQDTYIDAVNFSSNLAVKLSGGNVVLEAKLVTNTALIAQLKLIVPTATEFLEYPSGLAKYDSTKINAVYVANDTNKTVIVEGIGGGGYGVNMAVIFSGTGASKTILDLCYTVEGVSSEYEDHDTGEHFYPERLIVQANLQSIFVGKNLSEINTALSNALKASSGVTSNSETANSIINAVKNAFGSYQIPTE